MDDHWTTFDLDRVKAHPLAPVRWRPTRWAEFISAMQWCLASWLRPADVDANWEQDG